ncbi:MAG: T9SS type A sorting domain-containing protein [Flavobacteriales bacterium]
MKKIFIVLFMFIITADAASQYDPIISESKTWKCVSYGWGTNHFQYYLDGDSVIDAVTYKKLWQQGEVGDAYMIGLLREDVAEQKVFIRSGNTDALLYDFMLEEGDEASVYGLGSMHDVVVNSVTTELVGGSYRKKINFEDAWGPAYWVEGVGSVYGIPDAALGMVTDYDPMVTCYYEGNDLTWVNTEVENETCSETLFIETSLKAHCNLFPNPAHETINVVCVEGALQATQLNVLDMTGRVVMQQMLNADGADISVLPAGIYCLQLVDNGNVAHQQLLIVR